MVCEVCVTNSLMRLGDVIDVCAKACLRGALLDMPEGDIHNQVWRHG